MTKKLMLHEMESTFEDAVTASTAEQYSEWMGVPVPAGWSLIIDCEGDLVCMVPPGHLQHRPSLAEQRPEDQANSLERARVIAELLNASRDHYPFRAPDGE